MDLYKEILVKALENSTAAVTFPNTDVEKIVHDECYRALEKIKAVIAADSADDPECFKYIEKITTKL